MDEEVLPGTLTPFGEVVVAMVQGLSALWNAIVRPPSVRPELPAPPNGAAPGRRPKSLTPSG